MDIFEIEKIIRKGGSFLAESLFEYWPANGDLQIHENNLSLHIGCAFRDSGFSTLTQVPLFNGNNRKLDLLSLKASANTQVRIEAKKAFMNGNRMRGFYQESEEQGSVGNDLKRITEEFQLNIPQFDYGEKISVENDYDNKFGVVLIITGSSELFNWFKNRNDNMVKKEWMDEFNWEQWNRCIKNNEDALHGIYLLDDSIGNDFTALLYAIFNLKTVSN